MSKIIDNFDIVIGSSQQKSNTPSEDVTYEVSVWATHNVGETPNPISQQLSRKATLDNLLAFIEQRVADQGDIEELGKKLFDFLFPKPIKALFDQSLPTESDEILRIRLFCQDQEILSELSDLPWEYIHDQTFLALDKRLSISRFLRGPAANVINRPNQIRILAVGSLPADQKKIDVSKELDNLEHILRNDQFVGNVELSVLNNPSFDELKSRLGKFKPNIFHYAGHAMKGEHEGVLALCDSSGKSQFVSARDLSSIFNDGKVRLAILNGCETAASPEKDRSGVIAMQSVAAQLVSVGCPAVIGMQYELSDIAALAFTRAIYRGILDKKSLDETLYDARLEIFKDETCKNFWGIPVLYLKHNGEFLFQSYDLPNGPHFQVPSSNLRRYVGREEQIHRISKILLRKSKICVICGMAGIGKTELAKQIGRSLINHHYPDGVLWGGMPTSKTNVQDNEIAVRSILTSFYRTFTSEQLSNQIELPQLASIVRNQLKDKNLLIILDNVQSPKDLEHLLPHQDSSCSVLITSQYANVAGFRNTEIIPLPPLSENAGIELVIDCFGYDYSHDVDNHFGMIRSMIEILGGHPLAIQLACSTIIPDSEQTIYPEIVLMGELKKLGELLDYLDDMGAIKSLKSTFHYSLSLLSDKFTQRFASTLLFKSDFSAEAFAALRKSSNSTLAIKDLEYLIRRSLLTSRDVQLSDGSYQKRYMIHDLIYEYGVEEFGRGKAREIGNLARYYIDTLLWLNRMNHNSIDIEWANVKQVVESTIRLELFDEFIQLLEALTWIDLGTAGYLDSRAYWSQGLAWFHQAIDLGVQQSVAVDLEYLAVLKLKAGIFAYKLSSMDMTIDLLHSAIAWTNEIEDKSINLIKYQAYMYSYLAEAIRRKLGEQDSIDSRKEADRLSEQLRGSIYEDQIPYFQIYRSSQYIEDGRYRDACVLFQEFFTVLPRNSRLYARSLLGLGVAENELGNLNKALQAFDEAKQWAVQFRDRNIDSAADNNINIVYSQTMNLRSIIRSYREVYERAKGLNNKDRMRESLSNILYFLIQLREFDEAEQELKNLRELEKETLQESAKYIESYEAFLYVSQGLSNDALLAAEQSIKSSAIMSDRKFMLSAYTYKAEALCQLNRLHEAMEAVDLALTRDLPENDNEYLKALSLTRDLPENDNEYLKALRVKSTILAQFGRYEEARRLIKQCLAGFESYRFEFAVTLLVQLEYKLFEPAEMTALIDVLEELIYELDIPWMHEKFNAFSP